MGIEQLLGVLFHLFWIVGSLILLAWVFWFRTPYEKRYGENSVDEEGRRLRGRDRRLCPICNMMKPPCARIGKPECKRNEKLFYATPCEDYTA